MFLGWGATRLADPADLHALLLILWRGCLVDLELHGGLDTQLSRKALSCFTRETSRGAGHIPAIAAGVQYMTVNSMYSDSRLSIGRSCSVGKACSYREVRYIQVPDYSAVRLGYLLGGTSS